MHTDLYSKLPQDKDYLQIRIGEATQASLVKVQTPHRNFTLFDDPLLDKAVEVKNKYENIKNLPLTVNFKKNKCIGVVGPNGYDGIHSMVLSLCFSHSYHDLKCAFIYNSHEQSVYHWCKNLPHSHANKSDSMYIACNSSEAHELLCEIS